MFAVVITTVETPQQQEVSRFFETLRAARRWASQLRTQRWCLSVRIMKGGAGGMEVK